MKTYSQPVVKRSLFSWVFSENIKLQILLVLIIMVMVATRVLPLEMQKRVVNEAINLGRIDLLLRYCGIYLAAVMATSTLKFLTNSVQVIISQRATAAMRKKLYAHILNLPLPFFRNTPAGTVVASLVNELAMPGNFVGMAVAVPISNILTLVAFTGYLVWLNPTLAIISLSIYPVVLFLVPLLQKRVNRANRRRVDLTRNLSSKITESITGIHEIQGNSAHSLENNKYGRLVDRLYRVRVRWSLFRGGIKITNGFFTSLGPFLVFLLGGYLAIKGQLALGSLVAFLSAQEKLYEPWKELIEFYQVYQDAQVSYRRTMDYFDAPQANALLPHAREPYELAGDLEVSNLSMATDDGITLLDNISFNLPAGEHIALVGFSGSGKSTLALCVAQLYRYTGGHIRLAGHEVADLTKMDMARTMGIVSQSPFIFDGTLEENLLYGVAARQMGGAEGAKQFSGPSAANSAEQSSRQGHGQPTRDDLIRVLHHTGLFADTLRFGLNTQLSSADHPELTAHLVDMRSRFQAEFGESLKRYVEFFDADAYLNHSSVAANISFGTFRDESFAMDRLPGNPYFNTFLDRADLARPLLTLGAEISSQVVGILEHLPPDNAFFEQSPIKPGELPELKALVGRLKKLKLHELTTPDQQLLLTLALRFTPGKHKMASFPAMLVQLILEGRALFRELFEKEHPAAITFYDRGTYIDSQTILNNIFFGKLKSASTKAEEKVHQRIVQLLIDEDLLETIIEIGMQHSVGSQGEKLSGGQRQKLALGRAFLKNPRLLVLDEATSALDNASQTRVQKLLANNWKGSTSLISVVHRLDTLPHYDRILVMKAGKMVEMGSYDELMNAKGVLHELVHGRR